MTFKVGGLYAISALAFLSELIGGIPGYYMFSASWLAHEVIALVTALGFITGGFLIWHGNRLILRRHEEIEQLLRSAQGEFFEMLNLQYDRWQLSAAERDVALLTVKGLSVSEIADLPSTSLGTITSQNNSI
jgi:hypothetical protein